MTTPHTKRPRPGGVVETRRALARAEHSNPQRRTDEALQAAILEALAAGPLMKWELRDQLHEPEVHVMKQLQRLRDDGQVKVVGKRLVTRRWALRAWQPAPARAVIGERLATVVQPKTPPPTDSWWTKHAAPDDRDAFIADASARNKQAGWGRDPRRTRGES